MKKTAKGTLLITLGVLLLSAALGWYGFNQYTDAKAGEAAKELLQQLDRQPPAQEGTLPTVALDGDLFYGKLTMERIGLALPVYAEWDMERLATAPCRYSGSAGENDLIIAGHNYKSHFAALNNAQVGDIAVFTDAAGIPHRYQVKEIVRLDGTAVTDMAAGEWDLTLFTCTYGGKQRLTLRLTRMQ